MELHQVLLLAEFAGLVGQVDAAVSQGDQGGEAALPQVDEVGRGICQVCNITGSASLPQAVNDLLPEFAFRQPLNPFA